MTTKFLTLISVIGIASICVLQAQSPTPTESPSEADATATPAAEATASPSPTAKPTRTPKATPATSPAASPGEKRTGKAKATPAKRGTTTAATPAAVGGPGMVWVSTATHVYHKQGSRFYGKTKNGKFMTEAEARREGNRPARQENF